MKAAINTYKSRILHEFDRQISCGATLGRARSNDMAGRSTALAQALAPLCVLQKNKNVTISDRFICFNLTVKRRWRPVGAN